MALARRRLFMIAAALLVPLVALVPRSQRASPRPAAVPMRARSPAPVTVAGLSASADSCAALPVQTVVTREFTIEVPLPARVDSSPDPRGRRALSASDTVDCRRGCGITVMVFDDTSGGGHGAYVAGLLRAEQVTDSINADPATKVGEFSEYHSPARRFVTKYDSGIQLEVDCGDCLSASFFFSRPGRIAEVRYSVDDGEPAAMKRACELSRSARSFRWSGSAR